MLDHLVVQILDGVDLGSRDDPAGAFRGRTLDQADHAEYVVDILLGHLGHHGAAIGQQRQHALGGQDLVGFAQGGCAKFQAFRR